MSGVTLSTYRVVETAEEVELRSRRAAWERYRAATAELAGLRAQADAYRSAYGDRVARVPAARRLGSNASARRIEDATAEVHTLLGEHRQSLRGQVADAARQEVGRLLTETGTASAWSDDDALSTEPSSGVEQARRRRGAAARDREAAREAAQTRQETELAAAERMRAAAAQRSGQRRAALAERAATLLADVPETVEPAVLHTYREAVAEIVQTESEGRAILLCGDLGRRIALDNVRAEAIRRTAAELAALAGRLEVVGGDPAATLRRQIEDLVERRPERVPAGLAEQVAAVVTEADRLRHQKMAAAALRLSLTELRYDVGEGFETALASQGSAIVGIPGRTGYGLRVRLNGEQTGVRTEVVRGVRTAADGAADANAEKKFCDDYPYLLQRMRRYGVAADQLALRAPGSRTVETVADELIPAAGGQAAAQQQAAHGAAHRQMEAGR